MMGWLRKLLGMPSSPRTQRIEHVFFFLESDAIANMLKVSVVSETLWKSLFPDLERSSVQVTFVGDENLPSASEVRKGGLVEYKFGAMWIVKQRRDLWQSLLDGHAGYNVREFEFEVPIAGRQRGIVVSIGGIEGD